MSDVTRILSQIEQGDPQAAEKLLPLVYDELRKLAAAKLSHEKPGQTLQATALVHEAYVRMVGSETQRTYRDRSHFFATLLLRCAASLWTSPAPSGPTNGEASAGGNRSKMSLPR